jgi:methyl-accepting chemotaxis protein
MFKRRKKSDSKVDAAAPAGKAAKSIRFGVRGKLQTAFGVVALMTVAAAGVGIVSFSATEREFQRVASHDVPMMTDALRLSVMSGEISAAAARFVSARTAEEQRAIANMLTSRNRDLVVIMNRLRESQKDSQSFGAVEGAAQRLEQNLKALEKAIVDRTDLRVKLETRQAAVHKQHASITDKITPLVDDSYFEVVSAAEDVGKVGNKTVRSFINGGLQRMQAALDAGAEMNIATGLLAAAALTSSPQVLAMLEDRYTTSAARAQKFLPKLAEEPEIAALRQRILDLQQLADFKSPQRAEASEGGETERLNKIFRAHESFSQILIKLVDDLNFNLTTGSEDAIKISSGLLKTLAGAQISGLRDTLQTAAQTHLLTSLISEAAVAKDPTRLVPIRERFTAAAEAAKKVAGTLNQDEIDKAIRNLIELGGAADGIFALRGQELQADLVASQAVADNAAIQRDLDKAVAGLVSTAESSMKQNESRLFENLGHNRNVLLFVAIVSILAAGGIGVFYVQRKLVKPLTAIDDSMRRLSSGETELALPKVRANDEIASMTRAVVVFREAALERERLERQAEEQRTLAEEQRNRADDERARNEEERRKNAELQAQAAQEQASIIGSLAEGLQKLSEGDLVYRLDEAAFGSYRQISEDFNRMAERVAASMSVIATSAREVTNSATEISAATTDLSQRTEEQAASLEETSASMEEISKTVKANSEHAQHANELAGNTREVATRSGDVVAQAVKAMSRIEGSSKKIADIISVIDEIARQTNLLALNAAVEAARAGEAGRGFAVVASEVRSLAQRSAQAAKDIKDLIVNSGTQVQEGVDLVNRAGQSLGEIVASIKSVADIVSDIARASTEQAEGIDQVNKALAQMDEVTQQNSALVEENAATAKSLEQQAAAMSQQVGGFKLAAHGHAAPVREAVAAAPARAAAPKPRPAAAKPPAPKQPAPKQPVPKPPASAHKSNGAHRGPVGHMQSALATALKADDEDWKEF